MRLKKLRGSGGYVMANISDEQQVKGNLGGPDLFLAPMGRLEEEKISKYFCNTCEKESEGTPKIQYENPNEEVAENLILAEKGQYICNTCNGTIAEYREFKKQDEAIEVGNAKPIEPETTQPAKTYIKPQTEIPQTTDTYVKPQTDAADQSKQDASVSSIEGRTVYDEDANNIGTAKQVGIDANQSLVLLITKKDGTEINVPWNNIKKIGEVILLGNPAQEQPQNNLGVCSSCGFANKEGSKFCEECGNKL